MTQQTPRKILWLILLTLVVGMPYSTFLLQLLRFSTDSLGIPLSNVSEKLCTAWKELLLFIGLLAMLWYWIREKRWPFKITKIDLTFLTITVIGVIWGTIQAPSLKSAIFGFRYDFSLLLYYALARSVIATRTDIFIILKVVCVAAVPVFVFGILQATALPTNLLAHIGYSWTDISATGNPLPPYHLVGNLVRAFATFPGPNSLALYAGVVIVLLATVGTHMFNKGWQLSLLLISVIAFLLTYSRGHLLSVLLGYLVYVVLNWVSARFYWTNKVQASVLTSLIVLILTSITLGSFALRSIEGGISSLPGGSILTHDQSTDVHLQVRQQAWEIIKKHPEGTGLGTSGLATTNTGAAVLNPESWYIQIVQELGWLGILIVLGIISSISYLLITLRNEYNDKRDRDVIAFLIVAFCAIVFGSAFLPAWFEVGSILWWIFLGLVFSDYLRTVPRNALLVNHIAKVREKTTVA